MIQILKLLNRTFLISLCLVIISINNYEIKAQPLPRKQTTQKNSNKTTKTKKTSNKSSSDKSTNNSHSEAFTINGQKSSVYLNFNNNGVSQYLIISGSNGLPNYTQYPTWVSMYYDSQLSTIKVTCQSNSSYTPRNCTVYFSSNGTKIPVHISQAGKGQQTAERQQEFGLNITKIEFANGWKDTDLISSYGSDLYSDKIKYIIPKITYTNISTSKNIPLKIKYIDPKGKVLQGNNVERGYSQTLNTFFNASSDYVILPGFGSYNGNNFEPGLWTFEIWQDNKIIAYNVFRVYSQQNTTQPNSSNYTTNSQYQIPEVSGIYVDSRDILEYPKYNLYLDLGGAFLNKPWAFGYNIGLGFNIDWFNMQITSMSMGSVLIESNDKYDFTNPMSGEVLLGVNLPLGGEARWKLTPQIGFAVYSQRSIYGMAAGVRYDYLLCKHISFYLAPRANFLQGFGANLNFGFSFYI